MELVNWNHVGLFVGTMILVWTGAGYLKMQRGWRTGYTRKINHAFTLVAGAIWFYSLPFDISRVSYRTAGAILFTLLLFTCWYHHTGICKYIFAGYAREKDAPHEAFHVWFSWLVSLGGLLLVDLIFGNQLILTAAALLLGIGDALGEPIGIRFGRHPYIVQSLFSKEQNTRSLEGSGAVLVGSFLTALICFFAFGVANLPGLLIGSLLIALLVTVIEAITPHGLDNLTIPLLAALAIQLLYVSNIL